MAELALVFMELIENPTERATLGANALAALESQRGATNADRQCARRLDVKAEAERCLGEDGAMNPLAAIYRGVTAARNSLFDRGVLRSRRLNGPVVSVENLSAGGAGKTPFVIALGELLQARGVPFDVLSRGYGRKTRGALIVDPDGSPADFGDEPLLIARRLRVPVIVGESRYEAGKLAEEKFETQLHILDDGFQHRSVARKASM